MFHRKCGFGDLQLTLEALNVHPGAQSECRAKNGCL